MLISSWDLLVQATAKHPQLIPPDTLSGRIAEEVGGNGFAPLFVHVKYSDPDALCGEHPGTCFAETGGAACDDSSVRGSEFHGILSQESVNCRVS